MKKILTSATFVMMSVITAQAAEFIDIDLNADGYISFEEMIASMPDVTETEFKKIDVSLDGFVDADEFKAADITN